MQSWLSFEHLVKQVHEAFDGPHFAVEHDVTIEEPNGARHQIDVLLTSKGTIAFRILISCKSGKSAVGVDHVREWADIVEHTSAAAGLIVSPAGFTSGAITAAKEPHRRVSLWIPRLLTDADFEPDEHAPNGYLRGIVVAGRVQVPRFVPESFKLEVAPTSTVERRAIDLRFAADTRGMFYLRDEQDNVVGNLWDDFVAAGEALKGPGTVRLEFSEPRFLVLWGTRCNFKALTAEIEYTEVAHDFEIDLVRSSFAYENAVTGKRRIVPLSPELLAAIRKGNAE